MITVYGREQCVQCHWTTRFLSEHDVEYTYIDVDNGAPLPEGIGTTLPYVVAPARCWSGYRRELLKGLVIANAV